MAGTEALQDYAAGAAPLIDDLPPRLIDTLTLIDTGSDFLTSTVYQTGSRTWDREIEASLAAIQHDPTDLFTGIPEEDQATITEQRRRNMPFPP